MRKIGLFVGAALLVMVGSAGAQQQGPPAGGPAKPAETRENGLYMMFETTLGPISCKLFEKEAPVTVRTITGLATGQKSYIDPKTQKVMAGKRFFDGLTFHRVIPDFMIQGGDPLGTGEGGPAGPGFPFKDEFSPALKFDQPGRLAMANAGPTTNGSQFFITERANLERLNNKHTIFGQCDHPEVVSAIARVPRDSNDKPVKPVVIKHVKVERVGPPPAKAPGKGPSKSAAKTTKKTS